MAVSANEIWQQMTRIGILDVDSAKKLVAKFRAAASKSESSADESKLLAQFLILKNVVTRFQAKHLLAGRAADLRLGDYLILDRCDQPPLTRWVSARKLSSTDRELLYSCNDDLASDRWVDPAWLKVHETVEAPGLQPLQMITLVASDPWRGIVRSPLATGRSLAALAAEGQRWSPVKTAQIAEQMGQALAAMHAAQLLHGQVRPSRIWQTEQGSTILLRDGGRPAPSTGSSFEEHRWLDDDQAAANYLPPEYLGHDVDAAVACDIYALGATLFELYTGQSLRAVEKPDRLPVVVQTARDLGAAGDPLLRAIAYAIDPDPQGRFADMDSFARALSAVFQALGGEQAVALENTAVANELSGELLIDPAELSQPSQAPEPPPVSEQPRSVKAVEPQRTVEAPKPVEAQKPASSSKSTATDRPKSVAATSQTPAKPEAKAKPAASAKSDAKEEPKPARTASPKPVVPLQQDAAPTAATQLEPPAEPLAVPPVVEPVLPASEPIATTAAIASPQIATVAVAKSVTPTTAGTETEAAAPPRRVRKKSKRNQQGPIIIGSVSVAVLLLIVALILRPSQEVAQQRPRPPLPPPPVKPTSTSGNGSAMSAASGTPNSSTSTGNSTTGETPATGFQLVQDDRLLWAPPWQANAAPAPLEMVPPGSQTILSFRLSKLMSTAGTELRDWLNPDLDGMLRSLKERSSIDAVDIDRLTIALNTTSTGHPRATFTLKLKTPVALKNLTDAWKVSASRTRDGKTIFSGDTPDGDVFYTPTTEGNCDHFVYGPLELISSVAEIDGGAITMARSLQQLWDTTSQDADVVCFAIPNFLFADGREYLERFAPRALTSLRDVFIPDSSGIILTMGLEDRWYGEFRSSPSGSIAGPALVQKLNNDIQQLPSWAESFIVDANIDASWRMMAIRLPQYMRAIASQLRAGISADVPTFNFYLPRNAAPQVLVATTLALSSNNAPVVASTTAPKPVGKVMTTAELLDHPFSVSFEQEALKSAVVVILDEFKRALPEGTPPPAITILGGDLEKSGITQNQQIRNFTMKNRPLREALSELCRQANPDKTATSLADPKQSLIWVIDPEATDAKPSILMTTRPIATEKGQKLTKEFTGEP